MYGTNRSLGSSISNDFTNPNRQRRIMAINGKRKVLIITAIKIWLICFEPYAENKSGLVKYTSANAYEGRTSGWNRMEIILAVERKEMNVNVECRIMKFYLLPATTPSAIGQPEFPIAPCTLQRFCGQCCSPFLLKVAWASHRRAACFYFQWQSSQ